jgi:spore coat polysaccharide biosynthesis protein SpsF
LTKSESKNIVAIIQARIGSTRLPGKILKEVSGKPILWHVVDRLSHSQSINKIVVATTDLPEDDRTEEFCIENNISFSRGSSDDVLSRYYEAAKKFNADIVIRITSDCPVIDPSVIDMMLQEYLYSNKSTIIDYLSNTLVRTFPRGLDAEIFSFEALEKTILEAQQQYEREHVTPYIYQHPEIFSLKNYASGIDFSFHRWTVDTAEDYQLINKIYVELYQPDKLFLLEDILHLFERKPELISVNQNVKQKHLGE